VVKERAIATKLIKAARLLLADDDELITIEVDIPAKGDTKTTLLRLLETLRWMGSVGTSRSITIEDMKGSGLGWDGDGSDKILDVRVDGNSVPPAKDVGDEDKR